MKFYTTSRLSENIHETPEGYLLCIGVPIARTGEQIYGAGETPITPDAEGKVIIQRDAAEVFRPETIASFEGKSITLAHPDDFVNPTNWDDLTKGIAQNLRRGEGEQENDLVADFLITVKKAIDAVKAGLREVSCGYEADYIETGIGRGVQKNIIGNHIALVEEGRAGSSYAINDHKGKGIAMKLGDKIKAIFAKAQDEALKVADAANAEEKKGDTTGDESAPWADVMKACKDLGEKISKLAPQKDATSKATASKPAEFTAEDDETPPALSMDEVGARLAKLEDALGKLTASKDDYGDEPGVITTGDEEGEESEEESEDDDFEESTMTGDTKSRIEILAPGQKFKGKDAKAKALKAAYATTDGKAIIHQFTAGKAPDLKNEKWVDAVFVGVSELLKSKRTDDFAKTRTTDFVSYFDSPSDKVMTAEKLNEVNEKHWAAKAH
jgi:uncharacterized protein